MKKLFLLAGMLLLSGCASTLTSQNVKLASPSEEKIIIAFDNKDIDTREALKLVPYKNDFSSTLYLESNGRIGKGGPDTPRLLVSLRYDPKFKQDDFIGVTSMFLPFLAFVPDYGKEVFSVDYLLRDAEGNIIYSKKLQGTAEGNSVGYYVARVNAATELKQKLAKYVAENAARLILNDLNENAATIAAKANAPRQTYATTMTTKEKAAPPIQAAVKSDVDVLPVAATQNNTNAYAVVVGIEQYRQKLPTADFATHDAETVTEYLTKSLGYPEENVVTLINDRAALGDFVKYFEKWLPNNVEPGATVFVYYSGHGAPNPKTGDAYLVPYDGDPAFIDETGYSLKRMYAALGKLPAKSIVVALDSCFSGAGGRSVIAKGARSITMNLKETTLPSNNMTVLAASSGDQMSSTYDEKGHGLFTYFFLKGIKNEDVVATDGSLRLDDLFAYLGPQVERVARKQFNNEQTPQLIEGK